MQTKRTLLAGNGTLGGGENQVGLGSAAERKRERLDGLGHEPVEDARPTLLRYFDQPGFSQHAQMMRDGRLREAQRCELAYAGDVSISEPVDDREPGRIRERLETGREVLELLRAQRRGAGRAAGNCRDLLH